MEKIIQIIFYVSIGFFVLYEVIRIAVTMYRNNRRDKAPVRTERAVAYHKHEKNDLVLLGRHSTYVYYITFHTDFGEIVKLYMTRDDYFIINEGDVGQLTWQGEKFWKFVPENKEE